MIPSLTPELSQLTHQANVCCCRVQNHSTMPGVVISYGLPHYTMLVGCQVSHQQFFSPHAQGHSGYYNEKVMFVGIVTLAHLPTDDSVQGPVTWQDDNDRQYGESNIMIEYKQCWLRECVHAQCKTLWAELSIAKHMQNDSLTWAWLEATGMSALFHVLTDVNRSNSFPPDFLCPPFTNNEDEMVCTSIPAGHFKAKYVMERTGRMVKQMGTGGLYML
jgi:hypothetical protein